MGLGKTLQVITILWTLIKQSPFPKRSQEIKRALIVCPAILVSNWEKEFRKWLGPERIKVFAVSQTSNMKDFRLSSIYSVMIIGYEKMRTMMKDILECNFDVVVCDEGHRIKNANIKTASALNSIPAKKRIILSGTPVQNDLGNVLSL
jgi:DNA repair and recombination protein RAD54B